MIDEGFVLGRRQGEGGKGGLRNKETESTERASWEVWHMSVLATLLGTLKSVSKYIQQQQQRKPSGFHALLLACSLLEWS